MPEPLTVSESSGRIVLKLSGSLTAERVEALKGNIAALEGLLEGAAKKAGKKISILLDMNDFDGTYDVAAMEAMAAFAKHNAPFLEKTGVFGGHDKALVAGEITAALANRENIRFFSTEAEAAAWLAG